MSKRRELSRTMIERTEERLGICPERLVADSAYGSAEMLGWLVNEHAIEPHIWACSDMVGPP
jgi:hypothetical protein